MGESGHYRITQRNIKQVQLNQERIYSSNISDQTTLSTGYNIEEEHDKQERLNNLRIAKWAEPNQRLLPTLLKANPKITAKSINLPPRQDDAIHNTVQIIKQPLNIGINLLTTSAETAKQMIMPVYSFRKRRALRIHVVSSPIYEVHYERCPPVNIIESHECLDTLHVAELLLRPPNMQKAEVLDQVWRTVKYLVAYGRHSSVPQTVTRPLIERVRKLPTERRIGKTVSVLSVIPKVPVLIKQVLQAPPIKCVQLCCVESTSEPKKVKEIYVEEYDYHVNESSQYTYTTTTTMDFNIE